MSDTDIQLLGRYTGQRAEDAFAELVRRHLGLVYSAALRQVRSPQLAEEVAQSVFIDLARGAEKLKPDTILTAWLYQVTRRTSIDVVRHEASRQLREQVATEMNAMNATAADWAHIEPLLDEAMHALDETDRTAVLLRYFENKSLREVGATLGASENAAQKRVNRAVERLREFFAKRGVTVGASGLVVVISAHAVQAAPAGLAITISTAAALAGTTLATTTAAAAVGKALAVTTLTKALITAAIVALVAIGVFEARRTPKTQTTIQFQSGNSLADDGAVFATPRKWQSEILALKLRDGTVAEKRLIIEFGASVRTDQSNAPVAQAKLFAATLPKGPLQVNSSLGDGSFRNVRLDGKQGIRTMTISSATLEKDDPQKTQREIERYKKLGGYHAIMFPYELKNRRLILKGFPTTNAVGWGVAEFTVPKSEITFEIVP